MSQTIDHRIVEMRFDNKQFEAGTKQTMNTLGKLKEALKLPNSEKALDGLGKAAKNVKMDGLISGVQALERRFSTLGIVGMRVIENVTDGLMGKLHSAISFVTDSIVSGGVKRAMNIENAHFQLQALLKDESKVQAVMNDAMTAVDGTAYAYDEAAKAASQFAASGIQAGDDMLGALKGITGVAAMTNSSFEDISTIFTTVAGNGRLMGDQLLQLSGRGLNAASTIAQYFREVRGQAEMTEGTIREMVSDGEISFKDFSDAMTWAFGESAERANETFTGAMSNMKSALARIGAGFVSPLVEQNGELVNLFNALRIKINDVKSALVFDEQRSAISGLGEATKMSTDELSGLFDTIKTNGKVSITEMDALTKKGADAYGALTKYVNGVGDGSIRATYAIKSALGDLTNGTKVSTDDIKRFVEEGKIDLATFTSAMETEFGNEKTLSKQFTDWFLDHIHSIVEAINSADMTKPMEIFYIWVESIKNVAKGLLSVIKPVGKAFGDVFLSFNADDVISFSEAIEKLTSKLKLSANGSKNLHDAFQGIFSVAKLLIDIFIKLLSVIVPINKPIVSMSDGFLGLAGSMGRGLTSFTEMIRSCKLLKRAFGVLSGGISSGMGALEKLINIGKEFVVALSKMDGTIKLVNAVSSAFERLGKKATPYIESFINKAESMFSYLSDFKDIDVDDVLETISQAFADLAYEIDHFSFKTVQEAFETLYKKIQALGDLMMSNKGLSTFVTNARKFGEQLKDAFTWDALMDRLETIMEVFGKFFRWIRETLGPAFEDFNIGSAVAAGGGLGIIYALVKAAKAFEKISESIGSIPDMLGSVRGTLVAYQKELKAEALIKTAGAIAILAGALVLLSFADTDRIMSSAVALTMIAGTLMLGVNKLMNAINRGRELNNSVTIFARGLSSTMKKFGRSLEIHAIGSAVKNFAKSIVLVAGSIIALGLMYKKDKKSLMAAVDLVKTIGLAMAGMMAGMTVLGSLLKTGTKGFSQAALGILALSLSLTLCISALNKLFKMEFPSDWESKVALLGGMLAGLGILALALGAASKITGGNKFSSAPILAMAVLLMVTVVALNKLFKMEFPSDWGTKVAVLGLIFAAFGILMLTMGAAARLAGGAIKAAGTILSMCVFLGVVTASLMVLSVIPGEKLLKGAVSLGAVLLALGASLAGAGKVTGKDTHKTVLAMAIVVGTITAALGILGVVPFSKLLKSATALGSILLVLALNFKEISKITNEKAWLNITAMIAVIISIVFSLYVLAEQPWEKLLTAGASLSAVLLSVTAAFRVISNANDLSIEKIGLFLFATTSLIPIALTIYALSEQPWDGMLAAGVALSATLLALSAAFSVISKANVDVSAIAIFLSASASVGVIALALYELSKQPWDQLLAAATGLSMVLISMSSALAILTKIHANVGTAINAALALSAFIVILTAVVTSIGALFSEFSTLEEYFDKGIEMLIKLGEGIGRFVGAFIEGVIDQVAQTLPVIGENLSEFYEKASSFFEGVSSLDESVFTKMGMLASALLKITVAELVDGLSRLFGANLPAIGEELSDFYEKAEPFFNGISGLTPESMEGAKKIAEMILAITAADVLAGIGNFLGIGGNLTDFASELEAFGPSIKAFAEQVKDVKPEAVEGAASAAKIMAEVAGNLQGHGGFIQSIVGDKSLETFASELEAFGPSIKAFAEQVKDVKPEAVEGAASAAKIMAEVANNLPEGESLKTKIFGAAIPLSDFGDELTSFAKSIVPFCEAVSDVNPASVTGVSVVTAVMSKLAQNLPSSESLWDKIFGGGQVSISEFGDELVSFGKSMVNFSSTVVDFDPEQVNGVIESFKDLADLASNIQDTSASGLVEFSNQLSQIGIDSVDKFVQAFADAKPKAETAVNDLFKSMGTAMKQSGISTGQSLCIGLIAGIDQKKSSVISTEKSLVTAMSNTLRNSLSVVYFNSVGRNVIQGLINGMNARKGVVLDTVKDLCSAIINKFKSELPQDTFKTIGESLVIWVTNGMDAKKGSTHTSITQVCKIIIDTFKSGLSETVFKEIGANAALGLKKGIESKSSELAQAAAKAAQEAVNASKKALDVHSPSRVMERVGEYFSLGLAMGIIDQVRSVSLAGKEAANEAINPLRAAVGAISDVIASGDFDLDPVVRPVVDLSDVQKGASEIGSLMNQTYDISATRNIAIDTASSFERGRSSKVSSEENVSNPTEGNTYEFNQYNYSPKALSRSEIYRQTNNQFSAFRRAVNPT